MAIRPAGAALIHADRKTYANDELIGDFRNYVNAPKNKVTSYFSKTHFSIVFISIKVLFYFIRTNFSLLVSRAHLNVYNREEPRYPLNRRLGGSQKQYGRFGETRSLAPAGIHMPIRQPVP